jgi:transposase
MPRFLRMQLPEGLGGSGCIVGAGGDQPGNGQRRNRRLRIEHFPAYAPELNPDEGVWSQAKHELANGCPRDVDELVDDILRSIDRIRSSPEKLRGCILQSELPSFLR